MFSQVTCKHTHSSYTWYFSYKFLKTVIIKYNVFRLEKQHMIGWEPSLYTTVPIVTYKCHCVEGEWFGCVFVYVSVFACMHACELVYAGFTDLSDFPVSFSVCSCSHDVNTASGWQSEWDRVRESGRDRSVWGLSVRRIDGQTDRLTVSQRQQGLWLADSLQGMWCGIQWSFWPKLPLIPCMSPPEYITQGQRFNFSSFPSYLTIHFPFLFYCSFVVV